MTMPAVLVELQPHEYLTYLRRRKGMSQSELAEKSGFSQTYVSLLEAGTRTSEPVLAALMAIVAVGEDA